MTKYVLEERGDFAERAIYRSMNATVAQFKDGVFEKWVKETVFTNTSMLWS